MLKRGFDILLSVVCLIVFLPLMVVCCVAVKLEDGGDVFFRQKRVGLHGMEFDILKIRSMRGNEECRDGDFPCREDAVRTTRVGKFIRSHHLDELPQLLNVLKGDMSFVGYRPERQVYANMIIERDERYRRLFGSRPGITSYATLYNGYTDTMEKMLRRLEMDLYYLDHMSLGLDMKILWLTFASIVTGKRF